MPGVLHARVLMEDGRVMTATANGGPRFVLTRAGAHGWCGVPVEDQPMHAHALFSRHLIAFAAAGVDVNASPDYADVRTAYWLMHDALVMRYGGLASTTYQNIARREGHRNNLFVCDIQTELVAPTEPELSEMVACQVCITYDVAPLSVRMYTREMRWVTRDLCNRVPLHRMTSLYALRQSTMFADGLSIFDGPDAVSASAVNDIAEPQRVAQPAFLQPTAFESAVRQFETTARLAEPWQLVGLATNVCPASRALLDPAGAFAQRCVAIGPLKTAQKAALVAEIILRQGRMRGPTLVLCRSRSSMRLWLRVMNELGVCSRGLEHELNNAPRAHSVVVASYRMHNAFISKAIREAQWDPEPEPFRMTEWYRIVLDDAGAMCGKKPRPMSFLGGSHAHCVGFCSTLSTESAAIALRNVLFDRRVPRVHDVMHMGFQHPLWRAVQLRIHAASACPPTVDVAIRQCMLTKAGAQTLLHAGHVRAVPFCAVADDHSGRASRVHAVKFVPEITARGADARGDGDNAPPECPICMNAITGEGALAVRNDKCKHAVCLDCFSSELRRRQCCLCRARESDGLTLEVGPRARAPLDDRVPMSNKLAHIEAICRTQALANASGEVMVISANASTVRRLKRKRMQNMRVQHTTEFAETLAMQTRAPELVVLYDEHVEDRQAIVAACEAHGVRNMAHLCVICAETTDADVL